MLHRSIWIRLAALSACTSIVALIFGSEAVRAIAQVQFTHAMANFACATVMNIGGQQARWAPGFFLSGAAIYCGSGYAVALGAPPWLGALHWPGAIILIAGWGVLAWAAGSVDAPEPEGVASNARGAAATPSQSPRFAITPPRTR